MAKSAAARAKKMIKKAKDLTLLADARNQLETAKKKYNKY